MAPLLDFLASDPPFSPALEAMIVGMSSPGDKPPGCPFTEMRMLRTHLGPKSLARLDAMEAESEIKRKKEEKEQARREASAVKIDMGETSPSCDAPVAPDADHCQSCAADLRA